VLCVVAALKSLDRSTITLRDSITQTEPMMDAQSGVMKLLSCLVGCLPVYVDGALREAQIDVGTLFRPPRREWCGQF
jgi:hypothetical protein